MVAFVLMLPHLNRIANSAVYWWYSQ